MYLGGVHAFRATCAPSLSEQTLSFMTILKASQHLFFFFLQQHKAQACYLL